MNKVYIFFFTIIIPLVSIGQTIDIQSYRLKSASELIIKSFNRGCFDKGFWDKYNFDSTGKAISSEHYFEKELREEDKYGYNEQGLLKYEINKLNNTNNTTCEIDTLYYKYKYFTNGNVQTEIFYLTKDSCITKYKDYNDKGKPLSYTCFWNTKWTSKREFKYDLSNRLIEELFQNSDTDYSVTYYAFNKYNDVILDSIVYFPESNTPKVYVGGWRFPTERYRYKYDRLNRWTKKYLINGNDDILLETREYKN